MVADLLFSFATFKRGTAEKLSYILLELFDLGLTWSGISLGFAELNPFIASILKDPFSLLLVKVVFPVFIAWLVPRKLLWPSILLIIFVVFWDVKEIITHFC